MQFGHEIRIVTISRQAGSGGAYLAGALGARLGWPVVDRALLEEVARRMQAPVSDVQPLEEYVGGPVERLWKSFARGAPEFMLAPVGPDPDAVARLEAELIRKAVESPPLIIVGRGAQCLLHGRPDTLHVRMVAPLRVRAERLAADRSIPVERAREEARRLDLERTRYVQRHFHCDRDEPLLYDLQVNTGGIPLDEAVDLVHRVIERHRAKAGGA